MEKIIEKIANFVKKNTVISAIVASIIISGIFGAIFGYEAALMTIPNNIQSSGPASSLATQQPPAYVPGTSDEAKIINVVKQSSPSVVSIIATKDLQVVQNGTYPLQDLCSDPFFRQFFGNQCQNQPQTPTQPQTQKQQVAAGTGFVVSSDGMILTNRHVVNIDGAAFTVILSDGREFTAQILAMDSVNDVAVIKIPVSGLKALPLADSTKVQIGQTAIAIGNALGQFSNTVSRGVVSGLSRSITASDSAGGSSESLSQLIQTDAAINPGNSGGPLLNLNGEVMGINTAIVSGAQNIGFATPINIAKKDIQQVAKTGKITYAYLGVRYVMITPDIKDSNNLAVDYGALVIKGPNATEIAVAPGSPADKAGIKENDIILEVNGTKVTADNPLSALIQKYSSGDTVTLLVLRQGSQMNVTVTLSSR
ncbi:MAG: Uncharacterized protein CEN90_351 [Parcubacteria group bacterium Licking1014_17]|nr:MAG: Uncharacterized protein CEN90_351 [Parcubacteria group bacterium Licking1014_17]